METPHDALAAFFLQVPIDIHSVFQSNLQEGTHSGHKAHPTTKSGFLIALKGEADFVYEGVSYSARPGLALIGGYNRYFEMVVHSAEFEYFLVHFLPVDMSMGKSSLAREVHQLHIELDAALLQLMKQLLRYATELGHIELLEKKTLFYQLVNKALLHERYLQNSESHSMMEQTIEYIRQHYMEPITLEGLAEQHQMKAEYFSHLFQKYTGSGPIHYLIQYRMKVAYELQVNKGKMEMKMRLLPLVLVAILMVMTGCAGKSSDGSGGSSGSGAAGGSFPRTVTGAKGVQVTIAKKPEKVALVHWGLTEDLLSFDLQSIGVALPFTEKQSQFGSDLYKPYTSKLKQIVIVGENTEVNMEKLLQYGPDLIIAGTVTNQKVADQLAKIATTVFLDEEKMDVWNDWPGVMTKFGEILGQENTAKQAIDKFTAKSNQAKDQLKHVQGNVAYIQVREKTMWLQGTKYAGHYYEPLGLKPPEQANGDGAELTLEGLVKINPDHIFLGYFNYTDTSLPALADEWQKTEVWKSLKAVKENHVYKINGATAFGYGPISRSYGTDAIVNALKK
ncbi:MAG: iron-siderophore transporter substrate-binding protein [Paenibacillus sp.]|nr:iron-siderophore transporter substrate-binding protein [Paenibacillus sp.]